MRPWPSGCSTSSTTTGSTTCADDREWDPDLLRLRAELERDLEARLRERWAGPPAADFTEGFFDWVAEQDGVSLAAHVHRDADRDQVLELLRVRSIYHLQESDPTAWVVPRLGVRSKAALMELQYDEYGAGDPNRLHHHLFARGMEASGLDPSYGAYVDEAPLEILEQNNAMSLFGLHRRLRGAALGHLAAFEATSSLPSRKMAQGLERLGVPHGARRLLRRARRGGRRARAARGPHDLREPPRGGAAARGQRLVRRLHLPRSRGPLRPVRARPLASGGTGGRGMTFDHPDAILCPGGPMLIRGNHAVEDPDGVPHGTTRPVSAVCRCLKSASLPWCDGTHKVLPEELRPS